MQLKNLIKHIPFAKKSYSLFKKVVKDIIAAINCHKAEKFNSKVFLIEESLAKERVR